MSGCASIPSGIFMDADRRLEFMLTSGDGSLLVTRKTGSGAGCLKDVPLRIGESNGSYSIATTFAEDDDDDNGCDSTSVRSSGFPLR